MCGIYGITEKNPKIIKNIIEKCSHRGPNGSGIYSSENLTLGHNLLSITSSPKDGKQPWKSPKENVLIYNGEIFNYKRGFVKDCTVPKSYNRRSVYYPLIDCISYDRRPNSI